MKITTDNPPSEKLEFPAINPRRKIRRGARFFALDERKFKVHNHNPITREQTGRRCVLDAGPKTKAASNPGEKTPSNPIQVKIARIRSRESKSPKDLPLSQVVKITEVNRTRRDVRKE
jgi:hypothetical protein